MGDAMIMVIVKGEGVLCEMEKYAGRAGERLVEHEGNQELNAEGGRS